MRTMKTIFASFTSLHVYLTDTPLKGEAPASISEMNSLITRLPSYEWYRLTGADVSTKATVHITVETEED